MLEDLRLKVDKLKKEKNVIILAHNYQYPEIQDIADFVGDSLGLAMQASKTNAGVIIFCGVDFMAESAKILNPKKIVVHPDRDAKCPMAQMVDVESLQVLKNDYKDAAVVSYVNTTADVKVESDICCTSSNAVKVIRSLSEEKIIFVPDKNLGLYVQRFVPEKQFVFWPGCCPTHHKISKDEILELKEQHQNAQILVHPECVPEVIDIADFVYSTEGMVKHVKKSSINEFIIGTERELCYRLKKENPDKTFYHLKKAVCPTMKRITMDKVLKSLETLEPKVVLSKDVVEKAKVPLERMMSVGRGD